LSIPRKERKHNGKEKKKILLVKQYSLNECEAIKVQVEFMEQEILYFKGPRRRKAKKRYLRLLLNCPKICRLEEPVYLIRNT
jgi:hypothetical protein